MLDDGSGEVDEMLERNFTDVEAKLVKDLFWVINEPKAMKCRGCISSWLT